MIEITHTHADGTLVNGTERGDGTAPILKTHGFRWFPSIKQWGIRSSRDQAPRRLAINAAAEALRAAGHQVTVTLEDDVRDNATVRAAKHERLEDRRTGLAAKGERLAAESEALHRYSDSLVEHIPMGQPVLPGKRGQAHRNTLERSVNAAIKGAQTARQAEAMPERIAASHRAEARAERPDVIKRRVDRMEAEVRGINRRLDRLAPGPSLVREQYEADRAVLLERIKGDQELLEQARAEGRFGQYSKDNVHRDDLVRIRGQWRQVARANAKTVSVTTGYSWTDKYGWEEVRDLRCAHVEDAEQPTAEAADS
ncbi:DUF3560 domain-containing protein [Streptomyces sp. KAU_LT]|uniref:DUF3560 domain-containing protein n=1 Tax=Streptomyces sp. KAU_LT TaxID=3046669 RepID=UPI0024B759F5|nr:DUF3560 domain-containing protein [Streptomyces sp. KAU_LT]MDI9829720.1 DUF3560 domain-containing protein [Streptomyces sp. KAU_LT]